MNVTDRTSAAQIITAITSTGAKAPTAILAAYQDCQRVSTAVRQLHPGRDSLAPAVAVALIAGRDPGADPEVQRILIATEIGGDGIPAQVDNIVYGRFREVSAEHSDALVLAWRMPFDNAAKTLAECFDRLGPVGLEEGTAILQQGDDAAAVWVQAQAASRIIETIQAGWQALAELTRAVQLDPAYRVLRLAAVGPDTWQAKGLHRASLKPWEFLLAGLTLTLPTVAEYHQRISRITDAENQPETIIDHGRSHIAGRELRVETGRRAAVL